MNLDSFLQSGSETNSGQSPLMRLNAKKSALKGEKDKIIEAAKENGLEITAEQYHISELSIAKLCVPLIRKGDIALHALVVDSASIAAIEERIYALNSTSIKRLTEALDYSEAHIRLVKADIERRQRENNE